MNQSFSFPERLQQSFESPSRGVVGLVDDLLGLSREGGLQLNFRDNHCHLRPSGAETRESIAVPLQQSGFRAILARIAALCNERVPDSVSPYGGEGELSVSTDPSMIFRVTFTNTPDEQRLDLRSSEDDEGEVKTFLGGDMPMSRERA